MFTISQVGEGLSFWKRSLAPVLTEEEILSRSISSRRRKLSMDMQIAIEPVRRNIVIGGAENHKHLSVPNVPHRRRRYSKNARPEDYTGFEEANDPQEAADEEDDEDEQSDVAESDADDANESATDIENIPVMNLLKDSKEPPDKLRGFMKYRRQKVVYRPVEERIKTWNEITDYGSVRSNIREQAARCMDCGVPFCQGNNGCPLGNIIPKWNDYVFKQNWRQALEQLLQTNNFPEFTGRVCPAPCESACCLAITSPAVTIKSIECAIIDYAFLQGWMEPHKPNYSTGKRIAIIGSGPAGMAAAAQLNKVGHAVVVYEKNNRAGGLLRYGIPMMKLDKYVVDRRVKLLEDEGVKFITNTEIGKHVPADFLLKDNDAILVCTGAMVPRDLPIPNRGAKGICFAMQFLEKSQRILAREESAWEGLDAKGKRVIVLGGGDTATDCIGTCIRLGAESIKALEIMPRPPDERFPDNPWPQWPIIFRTDYGHEECKHIAGDDPRLFGLSTKKFLVSESATGQKILNGLSTVRVEWTKTENGAWRMSEVADSEEVFPCDLCILAMGFTGPEKVVLIFKN
ncbi:unnamed protein product [Gongylonema pulchrum]|uniref:Glutamate synthase n=1 Tax=Gongylonema pulchrum TaxID=637853 RepID=A0A183CUR0_9BILA|nr:unnamed protein product [Gongylonema pulchrum]